MKHLARSVAALLFLAMPAVAQPYGEASYASIPCNAEATGATLIVSRPPTTDELAAAVADRGAEAPALLLERDHLVCDGSVWGLAAKVPQYRGD